MNSTVNQDRILISSHGIADVYRDSMTGENALFATKSFEANELISTFGARSVSTKPGYLTLQTGALHHITLMPEFLQYINHSCEPNVFFDTEAGNLVALHNINPGDELLFFYPSTEWEMDRPFECNCGNLCCLQFINGAAHLPAAILDRYRLTAFIQTETQQKASR